MALWPALLLARERRLPWALRGLLAGSAVLLAEVALLSQSRGSLFATPLMLILVFALLPERTRTFAMLVPVASGYRRRRAGRAPRRQPPARRRGRPRDAPPRDRRVAARLARGRALRRRGRGDRVAPLASRAGGAQPAPAHRRRRARRAARRRRGRARRRGQPGQTRRTRLAQLQGRLRRRRGRPADQRPRQQPLRLLPRRARRIRGPSRRRHRRGQLPAAVPAQGQKRRDAALPAQRRDPHARGDGSDRRAARPRRARRGAARRARARSAVPTRSRAAVAAAALAGFGYWVVHGSVDWFWEFAGLGGPAFALLGLVCALDAAARRCASGHARGAARPDARSGRPPSEFRGGRWPALGALVTALAALASSARGSASCRCRRPRASGRTTRRAPIRA